MNDLSKILFGFIFSAAGIVLGWTLNQLSSWIRVKHEDKKNLKLLLFNLFETYNLLLRSDFDNHASKIKAKVFQKIPENELTEHVKSLISNIYSNLIENTLKPDLIADLKKIENQYQESILTLSKIDPLTAYFLSGKTSLLERFEIFETWFEEIKTNHPTVATDTDIGKQQIQKILKPKLLDESIIDLENYMRKIAWKINPIVWYRTRRFIKKHKINHNKGIDKKIDELFKQFEHPMETEDIPIPQTPP